MLDLVLIVVALCFGLTFLLGIGYGVKTVLTMWAMLVDFCLLPITLPLPLPLFVHFANRDFPRRRRRPADGRGA